MSWGRLDVVAWPNREADSVLRKAPSHEMLRRGLRLIGCIFQNKKNHRKSYHFIFKQLRYDYIIT